MRTRIFRVLAGILVVLFIWAFVVGAYEDWPWYKLLFFRGLTLAFALFALFGEQGTTK